ncbi:response regulator [Azospirillum oryzae]|uniref:Response regulator n=1 Tax=Azospirillum oryzae TaxID=286727 RepID=A0A6N1AX53_9PROT|nr:MULTISPECIES: response regulator [Azospirillum]KAA0572732.1 response regulator [Azospirillum sp. Sh1]KAA0591153.1 response regulator [Azospirillum oryzae]QKS52442.1 response regulator [Azospirillum oryzae]GLR82851.1 response regulator [Azospirillum oryzae]
MQDLTTPFEILLVEDDPADAGLAKRALRDGRILCNVSHVRDGVEAMEYLRRQGSFGAAARPDLILLDLNMPRMDGREVLQEMKADDELKTIPVVILTTSDVDRDVNASYLLGANSFITKPMDMDAFFDAVKSIEEYWFRVVRLPR